jgi:hypothetical protein
VNVHTSNERRRSNRVRWCMRRGDPRSRRTAGRRTTCLGRFPKGCARRDTFRRRQGIARPLRPGARRKLGRACTTNTQSSRRRRSARPLGRRSARPWRPCRHSHPKHESRMSRPWSFPSDRRCSRANRLWRSRTILRLAHRTTHLSKHRRCLRRLRAQCRYSSTRARSRE